MGLVSQKQRCCNARMNKIEAIRLLGGTQTEAAKAIGVRPQAISAWPEQLPPRIADRVQAALWRIANGIPHPEPADEVAA